MERRGGDSIMVDDLEAYAHKIHTFTSANEMNEVYYMLSKNTVAQSIPGITPYYPAPTASDYRKGFMYRHFIIRYTGGITEISNTEASTKKSALPKDLYSYIMIKWRILDSIVTPTEVTGDNPTTADVNAYYIRVGSKDLPKNMQQSFSAYFYNLEAFKLTV
jgi:hypothetical protein